MSYPTPEQLRGIADARERARVAGELAKAGRDAVAVRDEAIMELLREGELRPFEIGALTHVAGPQMTRYSKRVEQEQRA